MFGDGLQTRDFVFVEDIVAANLAASAAGDLPHQVYNIGTGTEVTVLELVAAVAAAADVALEQFRFEFAPARAGEVRRSCLDVRRARAELGLPPTTPLEQGLRSTLAWVAGTA